MKIKYTGVNNQAEITVRGVTFPKGKAVEVDDEELQVKLLGLDYFSEVKTRAKKNDKISG